MHLTTRSSRSVDLIANVIVFSWENADVLVVLHDTQFFSLKDCSLKVRHFPRVLSTNRMLFFFGEQGRDDFRQFS